MGWRYLIPTLVATTCWALSDICCDACIQETPDHEQDNQEKRKSPVQRVRSESVDACDIDKTLRRRVDREGSKETNSPRQEGKEQIVQDMRLSPHQYMLVSASMSGLAAIFSFSFIQMAFPTKGNLGWLVGSDATDVSTILHSLIPLAAGGVHFLSYWWTVRAFETESSTVITPLLQLSAVWMLPISTALSFFGFLETGVIHFVHFVAVALICIGGLLPAAHGDITRFGSPTFWKSPAVRYCILGEMGVCIYNLLLHSATFETQGRDSKTTQDGSDKSRPSDEALWHVMRFFILSRIGNFLMAVLVLRPQAPLYLASCLRFSQLFKSNNAQKGANLQTMTTPEDDESREIPCPVRNGTIHRAIFSSNGTSIALDTNGKAVQNSKVETRKLVAPKCASIAEAWAYVTATKRLKNYQPDQASVRNWIVAWFGQMLSVSGVLIVMISYSLFYEPSVVNALEGGMQQLINLLLASFAYNFCGFGRPVTQVKTKVISFIMISAGIYLSTF